MLFKRSKYFPGRPTPFGTLLIFLFILSIYYITDKGIKKRFPYINREENISLLVEYKNPITIDTTNLILKSKDKFVAWKRRNGIYKELNDSLISYYQFHNFRVEEYSKDIPFATILGKKGKVTPFTAFIFPLNLGDQWSDDSLGILSEYIKDDSLVVGDKKYAVIQIDRYLSSSKIRELKNKNIDDFLLYNRHSSFYNKELGWLKTVYPDSSELKVIRYEDLYWFEMIPRLFNIGVR
ncbi:MAG: hypothetical protein CR982_08095 [Candidatus Cloacimonadota bacterium]|nr:MAG: hypothetical protein CR982_08095 [Candidatus Cloacimonadota bacterium]PIE77639.1 MAG: hypothetical protein CSA15_11995 [Candidatus Delongbacteria bacterium]